MTISLSAHLIDCLKNNPFTASFYESLSEADFWSNFILIFENETLTAKLDQAITFRDCGDFNKAMLYVSEINRDHVTCLRKIQHSIDTLNGKPDSEVILRNFRQFLPLEVGMENSPDMLAIIENFVTPWQEDNTVNMQAYHACTKKVEELNAEIDVNLRFGANEEEIGQLQQNLDSVSKELNEHKKHLSSQIVFLVIAVCTKYCAEQIEQLFKSLLVSIATVCLSPIITKHASDVQVNQ